MLEAERYLQVDIVSAEALLFTGQARRVFVPGKLGEMGILPGHAPLLGTLRPGAVRVIRNFPDDIEMIWVSGGFVEVQPHWVTVLADTAVRARDMDAAAAARACERAAAALEHTTPKRDHDRIEAELKMYTTLMRVLYESGRAKR